MKLPFENPGKVVVLILIVIGLFWAYKANAETEIAVGPTFTSEFNGGVAVVVSERFGDRFDCGISLISAQSWEEVSVENNGSFFCAFVAEKPEGWWGILPSEVLIGGNYWFKDNEPINGCQPGYLLALKWKTGWRGWLPDVVSIGPHFSSSGVCKPNRGQDMLTFGWRF